MAGDSGGPVALDPPYYAVIFSSIRTDKDVEGYAQASERMMALAAAMPGFLGVESARETFGITVSYWCDLDSIAAWKRQVDHGVAQADGRHLWYDSYRVKIARVEREYGFERGPESESA